MRFSFWPAPSQPYDDVLDLANHVEATGWDGLWYADHFMPNAEDTSTPWPEAWITLAALGESTFGRMSRGKPAQTFGDPDQPSGAKPLDLDHHRRIADRLPRHGAVNAHR